MKLTYKKSKGFTLVELLVVVAIIATLAAIATPITLSAIKKAQITESRSVCVAFEAAVDNFEAEYNYLPFNGGGQAPTRDTDDAPIRSDEDIVAVLAGVEDELNFKQIAFFEYREPKSGTNRTNYKNGMAVDDQAGTALLYDPWGEPYYIVMDYDLDGRVDNPLDRSEEISTKCAIYSLGKDKVGGTSAKNRDNATNF